MLAKEGDFKPTQNIDDVTAFGILAYLRLLNNEKEGLTRDEKIKVAESVFREAELWD